MTPQLIVVAVVALLWLTPASVLAQAPAASQDDAPADTEPGGASVLHVDDAPDQIIRVNARIRHTTVIQLPAHETILDFVVGDSEYWHLTGAANLAFLKPIGERVTTNVALVCESGRIYSFLVTEQPVPPHLVVRINAASDAPAGGGGHIPAFVSRDRVAEYQQMAEQSQQTVLTVQTEAEQEIAAVRQEATVLVDRFRATYPTQLEFPYRLDDKAARWPFLVQSMWHDGLPWRQCNSFYSKSLQL